jgi:hypothetical protein
MSARRRPVWAYTETGTGRVSAPVPVATAPEASTTAGTINHLPVPLGLELAASRRIGQWSYPGSPVQEPKGPGEG